MSLPNAEQHAPEWQAAAEVLTPQHLCVILNDRRKNARRPELINPVPSFDNSPPGSFVRLRGCRPWQSGECDA